MCAQAPRGEDEAPPAWGMRLSSSLVASLRAVDVSCCDGLLDIGVLSSCVQLGRLQMSGTDVSDLTPLEACSQLEHLSAANTHITSLAPLGACLKLRTLDVSCCCGLMDIEALRSCVQLKCLQIAGVQSVRPVRVGVPDLSPLASCSQLEELFMAGNTGVTSLEPLKACTVLRKLDLRHCRNVLPGDLEDLRLSCIHLEDPETVEVEGLVFELRPGMPYEVQTDSVIGLETLLSDLGLRAQPVQFARAIEIAGAGAIPHLVQLLAGHGQILQSQAARTLNYLASSAVPHIVDSIVAAGAFSKLMQLLRQPSDLGSGLKPHGGAEDAIALLLRLVKHGDSEALTLQAARGLCAAADFSWNLPVILNAGGIWASVRLLPQPHQVQLHPSSAELLAAASRLIGKLAFKEQSKTTIATAGAIPRLVLLLGEHYPQGVRDCVTTTLRTLADGHAQNAATIADAGAILP
jgi:hypothetical protein